MHNLANCCPRVLLSPWHNTLQHPFYIPCTYVFLAFLLPAYRFHFPNGKPPPTITTETTMQRLEQVFESLPNYECSREKFHMIVTMCQVPLYWRLPLFMCTQLTPGGAVDGDKFLQFWRQ